jgi:hypothetical protein
MRTFVGLIRFDARIKRMSDLAIDKPLQNLSRRSESKRPSASRPKRQAKPKQNRKIVPMAESHHDKVAVISGAARGIGQAFAQRLARDGAHIVIADLLPATDTAKLVQEAGRQVLASNCDVSSESSVNALAAEVTARFGRCDILINCAGIYPRQPFAEMTFADWRRMQAINLDSVFLMCASSYPVCGRANGAALSTWRQLLSG